MSRRCQGAGIRDPGSAVLSPGCGALRAGVHPSFAVLLWMLLVSLLMTVFPVRAQDDLFITVSPLAGSSAEAEALFTTVSLPAAVQPAAPVEKPAAPVVKQIPVPVEKAALPKPVKPEQEWEQELLRDPFWPIGYFPKDWNQKRSTGGTVEAPVSLWQAAAAKLKISGVSTMNEKATAIVNGEFKEAGETVQILLDGKTYQWKIVDIEPNGNVRLQKLGIK